MADRASRMRATSMSVSDGVSRVARGARSSTEHHACFWARPFTLDAPSWREYARYHVVTLGNVVVVRESEAALLCRIDGHDRWIPRDKLCDGTTIAGKGDTGTLIVPRQFAVEWGLVPYGE